MAENLVKFLAGTAAAYASSAKDANTLYFVTDERRIYKGDVPFSGGIYKTVTEFPASGEVNVIYVNTTTKEVRFHNGQSWVTLVAPMGEVADGNNGLVTGDQVYDAIAAVNTVAGGLADRVGALEAEQDTQDAAIQAAQTQADKGVADAAAAKGAADAAQAAADAAQGEVDALEGVVATKAAQADLEALTGRVTTAEGEIDTLQGQMTTAQNDIDAIEADYLKSADKTELEGKITAEAERAAGVEEGLDERLTEVEAFFKLAEGESLDTALDTLVEIQNYLDGEGAAADQMVQDIADNKAAIQAEVTRATGAEKALDGRLDTAEGEIDALQEQIGSGTVDSRIEAAKTAAATDAQSKADAAQAAAEATAAADAQSKADAALDAAKTYADQAEADAIAAAATDATGKADAALAAAKTYADQAEADALAAAKEYANGLAGNYATAAQGAKADTALQQADITAGSANGTIAVKGADVAVTGLGTAAFVDQGTFATAAQGAKADTAVQTIATGTANGTIAVDGEDVAVKGLGTAAFTAADAYATAAQGTKADQAYAALTWGTI